MKYLEKLLGDTPVEWKRLGEVTNYKQPNKYLVKSTDYKDYFPIPVLTAGKTFFLGYTNETTGVYKASENPVIIFDDFTTDNKWVDFDFKAKSGAMKMIISKDESRIILKYIYYWLNTLPKIVDGDHKRRWINDYLNKLIPIPPLKVQQEIVRILDTFTRLIAELTAELTARKKQYAYYREKLLTFKAGEVEWKRLGEVTNILRGRRLTRNLLSPTEKYPVFHGGLEPLGFYSDFNRPADTVMIINVGASAGTVGYSPVNFWSSDGCFCLEHSEVINNRFLYYYLLGEQHFFKSRVRVAGIPTLDAYTIEKLQIPIPPLKVQQEIVRVLDKFDTLATSISEGLPREIELRKKQYEYYREQLLTFPEGTNE
ncbi:MAG: restriction endonuclease subunit S [Firmicutes bacterium]|nr:restriction endonuclease subunit S [Bacillota bacterium]